MWDKLCKKDKWKLLYAYIISPLLIMGNIGGRIIIGLYERHGHEAMQHILSSDILSQINLTSFILGLLGYLPVAVPPTIIRFILIRHKLRYGIEIYCYMLLSLFITRVVLFILTGVLEPTLGLLDSLIIYCVLSFTTTEYHDIPRSYRYGLTFFTICIVFILLYVTTEHFTDDKQYIFPIWEATALCIALNRHSNTKNTNTATNEQSSNKPELSRQETHISTGQQLNYEQPYQQPYQPVQAKIPATADTLINIGLAHIGRKTVYENQYMTPEQADERHNIEHPFIQALAQTFTDEKTRSGLSRHFMLYKELTLFIMFNMILKKDKELHTNIQYKLKEHLSLGLSADILKKRNDYWHKLSQKFHESYTRTHDMAGTLEYTFWSILPESIKSKGIFGRENIYNIFLYTYNAVEQEYKRYVKQIWGIE